MATGTVNKRKQRRIAILTTLALGLGLLGLSFSIPAAANLPLNSFDADDGNETVDAAETDWASPPPNLVVLTDLASGSADTSMNTDEDDVTPLITAGSVQGNKADILGIKVANERVPATGKDYLYLSWTRPADPSGNVDFDFELNKLAQPPLPAAGSTWNLARSEDDLLLTFELLNGGTDPQISLRKWVTTGPSKLCDSNPSTPCWGAPTVLSLLTSPSAEGSTNLLSNGDITFGEMAVDLGLSGIFTPGSCTSFASVYAKSRSSGASFNSQISDVVAPRNTQVTNCGSLTVTKSVVGPTLAGDQTSFNFSVTCGRLVDLDPSTATIDDTKTFSLLAGASLKINDIPIGSDCTVTETLPTPATHWAVSHDATPTDNANVAAVNDVPLAGSSVTFTNTRNTGAMAVSKTSTGGTGTFVFAVDCDGTDYDRLGVDKISITTTAAGTAVTSAPITGIPTGTVCSVTEDPHTRFSPTTPQPASGQVTIDAESSTTQTVAYTNIRKVADLTVDKTTSGGTGTFRFEVDCDGTAYDRAGTARLSITNAGTAEVAGIPTGTSCTVTETPHLDFNSSLRSPSTSNTVVIDDNGETVSFQNVRKTGTLTVSKSRTGGSATDVFTFEVDCTDNTFDRKGAQALTIIGSGSTTITGIPTGTSCVVTEKSDDRYASTPTPSNGTVIIDEDGETVSFSNVRNTGTLTISKTTTGGNGTFTFTVDCTDDAFDTTRTITDSNSATVTGIPTGTVCTVTETPDPLFSSTRSPLNGQRTIDDNGETVSFENVRKTGSLTIAKATTGGDGTFRFAVDCTDDRFDRSDIDVVTKSGSGTSAPITGIPTQTSCTVTETVPGGWAAVGETSKTLIIEGQETASFSNRKLPSGIDIEKVASAPTVHPGDKVTYTYTVTNTGENPLTSVVVVDDKCAPVVFGSGDTDSDKALDLTEVWTFTCTSTLTATTTNIATVTGTDPHGATPTDTDSATVMVIKPAIAIDKTPSATSVEPNTTVVYTYTVTNPGDVPLSAVTVSDDKCSPVTFVRGDVNADKLLQVGESWVFQCSQVQTGRLDTLTNVGTASGVDALGLKVTSTDTVSISVVAPAVFERPAPVVVAAPEVIAAPLTLPRTGSDAKGLLQLAGSLILLGLALVLTAGPASRLRRR